MSNVARSTAPFLAKAVHHVQRKWLGGGGRTKQILTKPFRSTNPVAGAAVGYATGWPGSVWAVRGAVKSVMKNKQIKQRLTSKGSMVHAPYALAAIESLTEFADFNTGGFSTGGFADDVRPYKKQKISPKTIRRLKTAGLIGIVPAATAAGFYGAAKFGIAQALEGKRGPEH